MSAPSVRYWRHRKTTKGAAFVRGFHIMYHACRTDYPCEGCEQPRWMAAKNAFAWARRFT